MAPTYSTITIRADLKQRLNILRGARSWDDFLAGVVEDYPTEELIAELERRLEDIRTGRVQTIPLADVIAESRAQGRKRRSRAKATRKRRP